MSIAHIISPFINFSVVENLVNEFIECPLNVLAPCQLLGGYNGEQKDPTLAELTL